MSNGKSLNSIQPEGFKFVKTVKFITDPFWYVDEMWFVKYFPPNSWSRGLFQGSPHSPHFPLLFFHWDWKEEYEYLYMYVHVLLLWFSLLMFVFYRHCQITNITVKQNTLITHSPWQRKSLFKLKFHLWRWKLVVPETSLRSYKTIQLLSGPNEHSKDLKSCDCVYNMYMLDFCWSLSLLF